jgi:hypothetical protein
MTDKIISQAQLKEVLNYDSDTGVFTRKVPWRGRTLAGSKESNGYWQISVLGKTYKAHKAYCLAATKYHTHNPLGAK